MKTVPIYAVNLLITAKSAVNLAPDSSPEMLAAALLRLQDAVIEFEHQMPLVNGEVQESRN